MQQEPASDTPQGVVSIARLSPLMAVVTWVGSIMSCALVFAVSAYAFGRDDLIGGVAFLVIGVGLSIFGAFVCLSILFNLVFHQGLGLYRFRDRLILINPWILSVRLANVAEAYIGRTGILILILRDGRSKRADIRGLQGPRAERERVVVERVTAMLTPQA